MLAEDPGHPLHHHQRHAVRRARDALHHPQHRLPRHRAPRHERGPAVRPGPRQQGARKQYKVAFGRLAFIIYIRLN